jgi:hypothetical protein
MQEEIENRSITLVITTSKLTARVLRDAMRRYLETKKYQHRTTTAKDTVKHGKQTVKQLVGQGKGVTNIEVTDSNIKAFERVANKYGMDFAVKRDASQRPPKYLVFFKAPDTDAMTTAFREFTAKTIKRENKPSILAQLHKFQQLVRNRTSAKERNREQEKSI